MKVTIVDPPPPAKEVHLVLSIKEANALLLFLGAVEVNDIRGQETAVRSMRVLYETLKELVR